MHRPEIFREDRVDVMHALMRAYPFATLVRVGADGPEANHLPAAARCCRRRRRGWPSQRRVARAHRARQSDVAGDGSPGRRARDLPRAASLRHAVVVPLESGARQGGANLELRRRPRLWTARLL